MLFSPSLSRAIPINLLGSCYKPDWLMEPVLWGPLLYQLYQLDWPKHSAATAFLIQQFLTQKRRQNPLSR
ncbi:hypothetical protein DPEC_G00075000 [Dallia pectoralis]|uniref:Uncharacterized protein n=1 Tax=Dallia pectoralis TaxID=75939 RepID=A0ACC2H3W6_DALPE|nr:hypothetical protein DPEC_G00075000 [Dallia pectoralis]